MSIWDSVRTAVDRVTGSSANVFLEVDAPVVQPGESVTVRIAVKNGPSALRARAVLLEIQALETIELPRYASFENVVVDFAASAGSKPGARREARETHARNTERTFETLISVSPGMKLSAGEERKFQWTFRLPGNVQPTYEGKYARHQWRMRARLDVLGTDPDTGWVAFRVNSAR